MNKLIVSPAPHIKDRSSTSQIMRDVLLALLPATLAAVFFFRLPALLLIISGILSAGLCEWVALKIKKVKPSPADFYSAAITGLLLALIISPACGFWIAGVGAFIAIIFAKHVFGGLGYNIFNPALIGRAFLLASWPQIMTTWQFPFDALACATPLSENPAPVSYLQLFLGNRGGSIGETSALAILIGAAYLLWRRAADWRIPAAYLGSVAALSILLRQDPLFNLMAGGLLLGAFFMATDPVTSPVTRGGRYLFGLGAGIITVALRCGGGYPEGVCYAILIMNAATPLLDRYTRARIFGHHIESR